MVWGNDAEKNRMFLVGYGASRWGKGIAAGTNLRHYRHRSSVTPRYAWSFDLGTSLCSPGIETARRENSRFGLWLSKILAGHIWENSQPVRENTDGNPDWEPPTLSIGKRSLSGDFVLHNDTRISVGRASTHPTSALNVGYLRMGLGLRPSDIQRFPINSQRVNGQQDLSVFRAQRVSLTMRM